MIVTFRRLAIYYDYSFPVKASTPRRLIMELVDAFLLETWLETAVRRQFVFIGETRDLSENEAAKNCLGNHRKEKDKKSEPWIYSSL